MESLALLRHCTEPNRYNPGIFKFNSAQHCPLQSCENCVTLIIFYVFLRLCQLNGEQRVTEKNTKCANEQEVTNK